MARRSKKHTRQTRQSPRDAPQPLIFYDYVVKRILSKKTTRNGVYYLVEWEDYPDPNDFTWEPIDHLFGCLECVRIFERTLEAEMKLTVFQLRDAILKAKELLAVAVLPTTNNAEAKRRINAVLASIMRLHPGALGISSTSSTSTVETGAQTENDDTGIITEHVSTHDDATSANAILEEIDFDNVAYSEPAPSTSNQPSFSNEQVGLESNEPASNAVSSAAAETIESTSETTPIKCPNCKYTSLKKANIRRHIRSCEMRKDNQWICDKCGKRYPSDEKLKRHIRYVDCQKQHRRTE